MGEILTEFTGLKTIIDPESKQNNDHTFAHVSCYAPDTPAWGSQKDGDHYKTMRIQPMEYSMANELSALQHTIIKYVSRYKDKNGVPDLIKAKHCIDMLIDWETKYSK